MNDYFHVLFGCIEFCSHKAGCKLLVKGPALGVCLNECGVPITGCGWIEMPHFGLGLDKE